MISAEKARFPVSLQCELLGVSRSGYYEWLRRGPSDREIADELLTAKIREIHKRARASTAPGGCTPSCGWVTTSRCPESG
jgi:S-ribosylhomocysteine lyase LuxS involved in autoinducer biosynthesis